MKNLINKFYDMIDKIGKYNFILIAFVVIVLIITSLYSTFSLYTSSEGIEYVDGLKTYKFVLDSTLADTSIIVPANTDKNIDIVVTNNENIDLKYGIYYNSSDILTDVVIGYVFNTLYPASGNIEPMKDNTITLKVSNNSSSNVVINFGVSYGFLNGGDLNLPSGSSWIDTYPITGSEYIQSLYSDGSNITTVNIAGDSSKPEVHLNTTQGIMLDNNGEYRYYGANPNNYVSYNGELWRIISVSNVKSSLDDPVGEMRIKIVKADMLTDDNGLSSYSYDSSASDVNTGDGVNDWSKSDLMNELNTLYYNSTSGTCYNGWSNASTACNFSNTGLGSDARNMIDNAIYYLGGISSSSGLYANDYYTFERGTEVYSCGTDDGACPRATTWIGKVGLIYPSDYVYATDLSVCTKNGYNYADNTNCKKNDWLLNSSNQWTIAPFSSIASYVFFVDSTGYVDSYSARNALVVRPVIYLKSNVAIGSGEGTIDKPYQLELT